MKLSIVIPVYLVENTLERCVRSIQGQSFTDYELILIDDGSPDRCPTMCDNYAAEDSRVRVIHQRNGGLSAARNAGIDMAQGDYITFIDSDDYIGDNTLSILMSRLGAHPDYDILEYPVCRHDGDKEQLLRFGTHAYDDMRLYWLDCQAYTHAFACNKIFARHLFKKQRFSVGRYYEDVDLLPRLLSEAHLVATTEEGVYHYTCNPDSITMNPDGVRLSQLLDTHVRELERLALSTTLTEYYAHVLNIQIDVFKYTHAPLRLPTAQYSYSDVAKLSVSGKMKAKLRLLRLIGMKNLCRLSQIIHPAGKGR